ncbi:MAG: hypothetical protein ACP5K9_00915 [Candidatus Micrarchaeia archaeon]
MDSYDNIFGMLETVENASKRPESVVIDSGKVFSSKIEEKMYSVEETRALLSKLEGIRRVEQVQYAPEKTQFAAQQQPRAGAPDITKEIEQIVGNASKDFEKSLERELEKIETKKLILPSLSLQDQLSELEKISEGLDEQVFDDEQLKIIVSEVKGLRERLKFEKMPAEQFQSSFIVPRNNRLMEVEEKLYKMGRLPKAANT